MYSMHRLYRKLNSGLELGFYVGTTAPLSQSDLAKLQWLFGETFEPYDIRTTPHFFAPGALEIGPRITIETPFSTNAVGIARTMGLSQVARIECTQRYRISIDRPAECIMKGGLFDKMTEEIHAGGIKTFSTGIIPEPTRIVDVLGRGTAALEDENAGLGLGMDAADIEYYLRLFTETLKRNPTDVELFQLGNANSEHSRHWFFRGKIVIDDQLMPHTLMQIVRKPLECLGKNNITLKAFDDNAGVSRGFGTFVLFPAVPSKPSEFLLAQKTVHIAATAETHNHPTFVAPFPGAETGAGGRIRDNVAVGRGGYIGVGAAGYFVGNLFIRGYQIPGEAVGRDKPSKYAQPLEILIRGSDGVSSYGNKIGEPLTSGWTRSFEQIIDGEWRAPRKPVLWSGGVSHIFDEHLKKEEPEVGMLIVRIGGPAYPIGVGGGAASSMAQGQNTEQLDFNSVQRGNPEMENRVNRVIRTCVEMGNINPISSIHDQGAGGPSNVLTELMEPLGGRIDIRKIELGDKTMSVLQIWSAEFQEGYGLLIRRGQIDTFKAICERERVNCEVLGEIDGSRKVVVEDTADGRTPVDLDLGQILTNVPQKTFASHRKEKRLAPLNLPDLTIAQAVKAVFAQLSVCSKGFLVHKVDRHVTGLVAQQQCCGIAQIPIADASVNAQSHFGLTGAASSIGEQPIKMLIDEQAGARMAVGESLTNMASVLITNMEDIRYRANWMWAAKLPHEGALLYYAATAMSKILLELGLAVNGGKDSLSMSATVSGELVKAPGSLVMYAHAPVQDITQKVTPDIKKPGGSYLYLVDLGLGKNRLGGSALAQACNQLGNETPDVENAKTLKYAFIAVQEMVRKGIVLAVHDRSDGGLITAVAEMCMASRCGFELYATMKATSLAELFAEELGFILEVESGQEHALVNVCEEFDIPCSQVGLTRKDSRCMVTSPFSEIGTKPMFSVHISDLRTWWETTSFEIEKLQMNPVCAENEYAVHSALLPSTHGREFCSLRFTPQATQHSSLNAENPRVAILREEGTNGDREMAAAFKAAGLAPYDVNMQDLLLGKVALNEFQGVVFPGGFSYMDVCDSAKGWAAGILFNDKLKSMFDEFYARSDTFSLGVCNGCQLMALLGWVPWKGIAIEKQPRFVHNVSGRFESRWAQVEILPSPSVLFAGMQGSKLGIWAAHGEGRLIFPDPSIEPAIARQNLAPLAYLDPHGNITEEYPYNPNGSIGGIAALCSLDGRHLAMMPHPERCFLKWQWPWMPQSWNALEAAPWLQMFQNARQWCMKHRA